jgi:acyl dehydratase
MPEFNALQAGQALPSRTLDPIPQIDVVKYAGASGDFNQIHTVPEFAAKAGLPSTIAHGMMSMGLLGSLVTDWMGSDCILTKYGVRFAAMTFPGDVLTLQGTIQRTYEEEGVRKAELDLAVTKQDGTVTVRGWATVVWRKP